MHLDLFILGNFFHGPTNFREQFFPPHRRRLKSKGTKIVAKHSQTAKIIQSNHWQKPNVRKRKIATKEKYDEFSDCRQSRWSDVQNSNASSSLHISRVSQTLEDNQRSPVPSDSAKFGGILMFSGLKNQEKRESDWVHATATISKWVLFGSQSFAPWWQQNWKLVIKRPPLGRRLVSSVSPWKANRERQQAAWRVVIVVFYHQASLWRCSHQTRVWRWTINKIFGNLDARWE